MLVLAAGVLAGLAVLALLRRPAPSRLRRVLPPGTGRARRAHGSERLRSRLSSPVAACLLAAAMLVLVVAPPLGVLLGATTAVLGPRLLARLEPARVRRERERLERDLPLLLDLLAACLTGGASLLEAARAVGNAVSGPAGARLHAVAAALAVGTPPPEAWQALAPSADDPLAPAARALVRAAEGGAPVARAVRRLAADVRSQARSSAEQAARRVGVLAVLPLAACFLPAFVLLGVVPVVVGLATPLLASF